MMGETRYAKSDGLSIAYQVVGNGPIDLVFVMGWVSHVEFMWTSPHFRRFLERLASFSRLILFDKRGTGLSDRPVGLPHLEQRVDDVRAVMDAVGSERAALLGISESGSMCTLFAATHPERTRALIILGGYARQMKSDDHPWGRTPEQLERFWSYLEREWGSDVMLDQRAPSMANDEAFRDWWSSYLRMSASPGAALALSKMNHEIDIRHILPTVQVPTLVVHRRGDRAVSVEAGEYLAGHIPGARLAIVPGDDHLPFIGDQDVILDEVEQFLTGSIVHYEATGRTLATIVAGEIVGAAAIAARMDAESWRTWISRCNVDVAQVVETHRGSIVESGSASFVAAFDGPARAITCARAISEQFRANGLPFRAGIHTGECERNNGVLSGVARLLATRVMDHAVEGKVVVSRTVVELVAGSGITFERGEHRLMTGPGHSVDLFTVIDVHGKPQGRDTTPVQIVQDASPLSPREREVAVHIGHGLSNRLIADELSISIATVERHAANIFNKLGVHSRAQVAVWAAEQGLLRIHHV